MPGHLKGKMLIFDGRGNDHIEAVVGIGEQRLQEAVQQAVIRHLHLEQIAGISGNAMTLAYFLACFDKVEEALMVVTLHDHINIDQEPCGIDPNLGGSNVEVESEEFIKSDEND